MRNNYWALLIVTSFISAVIASLLRREKYWESVFIGTAVAFGVGVAAKNIFYPNDQDLAK